MKKQFGRRAAYAAASAAVLAAEVLIALFVRDSFIRPYGGDILVTVLICCFMRIFFLHSRSLPVWVFAFAAAVEVGQYFDMVTRLGLEGCPVMSIALGSTFSWADLICYGAGCLIFHAAEAALRSCRRVTSERRTNDEG